jgi:hypothetical protein
MVATGSGVHPLDDDDLNVKKRRTTTAEVRGDDPIRRTVLATSELYRGLAEAIAEGLRAFNVELDPRGSSKDLPTAVIDGVAEGNARFFEEMAASSRRAVQQFKRETVVVEIDYARLARLVADELKRSDPTVPVSSDL